MASVILENDHDSTMTSEDSDSDFDEYNYGGLDNAWWEENAKDFDDLENGTKRSDFGEPAGFEDERCASEITVLNENEEAKLPPDAVRELDTRIAASTLSPFDRFRSPRGALSVFRSAASLIIGD